MRIVHIVRALWISYFKDLAQINCAHIHQDRFVDIGGN